MARTALSAGNRMARWDQDPEEGKSDVGIVYETGRHFKE